jgi:hypothetical protein
VSLQVVSGLLLYLGVGVLSDILVTAYYIFVGKQWATLASLASIPIALLNFWVLDKILVISPTTAGAILFAIGNALGCFVIMTLAKKLKDDRLKMPKFKTEEQFFNYVITHLQPTIWGEHVVSYDGKRILLDSVDLKVRWRENPHLNATVSGKSIEDYWIDLLQTECCYQLLRAAYPIFLAAVRQSLPSKTIGPDGPFELGRGSPYFVTLNMDDQKVFIPGHLICEAVETGLTGEPLVAKVFLSQEGHPIQ